jgi:hypothetical protein
MKSIKVNSPGGSASEISIGEQDDHELELSEIGIDFDPNNSSPIFQIEKTDSKSVGRNS